MARDRAGADHGCPRRDQLVAQTLVRTFFVIVKHERPDRGSEVRFAERHHSVQALGLDRFDKAFRKRVQIGTPRRQDQWGHATVAQ